MRSTTAEDDILSRDRAERAAAFQVQLAAQQQKYAAQLRAAESLSQQLQLKLTHTSGLKSSSSSVPLPQRRRRVRWSRFRQPSGRLWLQQLQQLHKRRRPLARSGT